MNRTIYKYDEDLMLRDLKPEQSGQYHCKATSLTGSIKSTSAVLTVFGKCKTILPVNREHYSIFAMSLKKKNNPNKYCGLQWNIKGDILCKNHFYKVFEHSCVASVCKNNQPVMVKIHTLFLV